MFTSTLSQTGAVLLALVCLFSFFRGGWVERLAAVALAVNWVGCEALQDLRLHHHAQPAIFAIDLAYLVLLGSLCARAFRVWLIAATAFQLMIVITHLAEMADVRFGQWAFFTAYLIWSYMLLTSLALGVALEVPRLGSQAQRT